MTTAIEWYQLEWGYRLHYPGGEDVIRITKLLTGIPNQIEFILRSAEVVTWAKRLYVRNDSSVLGGTGTADSDHGPNSFIIPVIPAALANAKLVFNKNATLGVITDMYEVGDLSRYSGKRVEFTWLWDWGGNFPPPGPPGPHPPVLLDQSEQEDIFMNNVKTYAIPADGTLRGDGGATVCGFIRTDAQSEDILATITGWQPGGGSHPTCIFVKRLNNGIWFRVNFVNDAPNGTIWVTFYQGGNPNWAIAPAQTQVAFNQAPYH